MKTENARRAFAWIVGILREYKIPFQITGGLAANVYGSSRPLADIDIEIPDNRVLKMQSLVMKHIIYGPKRFKSDEFDLLLFTLRYKGQEIDICGSDSQLLRHKNKGKRIKERIDLTKANRKKVFDLIVPVIRLKDLIRYKRQVSRDVDIKDCQELAKYV